MAKQFITGITYDEGDLEWTTFREVKHGSLGGIEAQQSSRPTDEETSTSGAEADSAKPVPLSESLANHATHLKGQLRFALPSDKTLMQTVSLPTTDPEEIESMVEHQVDKFSPFPVEHMIISHEVLNQTESQSLVLIVATRSQHMEEIGAAFKQAKLRTHSFDVDLLARAYQFITKEHIPKQGRYCLLLFDKEGTDLLIFENGQPLVLRSLGHQGQESQEVYMVTLAEEINYSLTSLDTEIAHTNADKLQVWHWGHPPNGLSRISDITGLSISTHRLDTLPPVSEGTIERFYATEKNAIDLTPTSWIEENQKRAKRNKRLATVGMVTLAWLLMAGFLYSLIGVERSGLEKLNAKANELAGPAKEVAEMRHQLSSLSAFTNRNFSSLECLREITVTMPAGIQISSFSYRKSKGCNIRGKAGTRSPIYEYKDSLDNSPLFVEVDLEEITQDRRGGASFKIKTEIPGSDTASGGDS